MMRNDQRGMTIFEVLLSISIGSVALMILMSILTVTLLSKNESEYSNRLAQEVYFINERLRHSFDNDLGYKSITEFATDNEDYDILVFVDEYDFDFDEAYLITPEEGYERRVFVLWLDRGEETNGLYYFEYPDDPETIDMDNLELARSEEDRLGSSRLVFGPESKIAIDCLREHPQTIKDSVDLYSDCSHAYIYLDFHMALELRSGGVLDFRRQYSTLFY